VAHIRTDLFRRLPVLYPVALARRGEIAKGQGGRLCPRFRAGFSNRVPKDDAGGRTGQLQVRAQHYPDLESITGSGLTILEGQRRRLMQAVKRCQEHHNKQQRHQVDLRNAAAELARSLAMVRRAPGSPDMAVSVQDWQTRLRRIADHVAPADVPFAPPVRSCLRVAVVGRTEAGKSTLLNAMLGREVAAVGDGAQRATRAPRCYRLNELVELVDTPGVAAQGGRRDERLTAEVVQASHFVLYVFSDDQIGSGEAAALQMLSARWRPCITVVNFKKDIDGRRSGRSASAELNRARFLADRSTVFSRTDIVAHEERLGELLPNMLARSGGKIHPVHALAAALGYDSDFADSARELRAASGVDDLMNKLTTAARRGWASASVAAMTQPQRAALQCVRDPDRELCQQLEAARSELYQLREDWASRLESIIDRHASRFAAGVTTALSPLRDAIPCMVEEQDRAGEIGRRLDRELAATGIDERLQQHLDDVAADIASSLSVPIADVDTVWWEPPPLELSAQIDVGEIILRALLDSIRNWGVRGVAKLVARLVARGGAAGAGSGGIGTVIVVVLEIVGLATRIRRDIQQKQRHQNWELIRLLRRSMNELQERLVETFRDAVLSGDIDSAVQAHREALTTAGNSLDVVRRDLARWVDQANQLEHAWLSLQLRMLDIVHGTDRANWHVARGPDGRGVLRGKVPWAALLALEWSTSSSLRVST
jgi:hypothetical protein